MQLLHSHCTNNMTHSHSQLHMQLIFFCLHDLRVGANQDGLCISSYLVPQLMNNSVPTLEFRAIDNFYNLGGGGGGGGAK